MKNKSKNQSPSLLYLIICLNGLSILLVGILVPSASVIVGALFGMFVYYLTYSVPARGVLWMELRLFVIALVGISLGHVFLWAACYSIQNVTCMPSNFRALMLTNYAFPLLFLSLTWLFFRLPMIIKVKK